VAVIVGMFDRRIRTRHELERFMNSPVLVEIPSMITPRDIRRARRKKLGFVTIGIFCGCIYCCGLYYLYTKQAMVVRLLDPVIEKIAERAAN
jgi:hypothetical protein